MKAKQISKHVKYPHIVITGGEPLIWNLDNLIEQLGADHECFLQLETCGAFEYKGVQRLDFVTVSPKEFAGFKVVVQPDEFKFVVDGSLTEDTVMSLVKQWSDVEIVSFMPEGSPPTKKSRERAYDFAMSWDKIGPPAMYSDRLQYILGVQ
jgi:organic radical activating enzyme